MDNRRHSQDPDRSGGEAVGKAQDDEFESDDEADAEEDEAEQGTDQF